MVNDPLVNPEKIPGLLRKDSIYGIEKMEVVCMGSSVEIDGMFTCYILEL